MKEHIFNCPEESRFYSYCIEMLLFYNPSVKKILELGSGDGIPVINAIQRSKFQGFVQGYEISPLSFEKGIENIRILNFDNHYTIFQESFFNNTKQSLNDADAIISNPPYLPSSFKEDLIQPSLCGGDDGTEASISLLSMDFNRIMILISSFSNPVKIMHHAQIKKYRVSDFLMTRMPFGIYSSQKIVRNRIEAMQQKGTAFFSESGYLLAGILFEKKEQTGNDLSGMVQQIIQTLK